jgi:16S rRNA (cytidine1402-2'-O)-methyltransferase
MPGTLFVVATPIGNLEDITLRALRVLREVDLIACEDTRQTAKLLSHYQIQKPTTSYHEHNEVEKAEFLLEQLQSGKQIALVSDAGTPCISDPGYRIVNAALLHQIRVVPIPGPCSFIAALSASGRPSDSFTFLGFLPARKNPRRALLLSSKEEPRTLIFFEAPGRLLECLSDVREFLGERRLTVAREISKVYEEIFSGSSAEAYDHFCAKTVKGEVIVILEKAVPVSVPLESLDRLEMGRRLEELVQRENISKNEGIKVLSRQLNTSKRELYQLLIGNGKGEGGGP